MQVDLSMTDQGGTPHNVSGANNMTAIGTVTAGTNMVAGGSFNGAGGQFQTDASGRVGSGGYAPNALPGGWGGGVSTADVYAHGSVGVGSGGALSTTLWNNGSVDAANGKFHVGTDGVLNLGAQGAVGAACAIASGAAAITTDAAGVVLSCQAGTWKPIGGQQQKQAFFMASDGSPIAAPICPGSGAPRIIVIPANFTVDPTASVNIGATGTGPWTVVIRDGSDVPIAGAVAEVETYCAF